MNTSEVWNVTHDQLIKFSLDTFQIASHWCCIAVGVPLNLAVGLVIACNRRLHSARNVIWLGVVLSNLLTLAMAFLEVAAVCWSDAASCAVYSIMIGKPYVLVLLNMLLAACDRGLYLTNPLGHKRHVTVRRVVAIQVGCSLAFLLLLTKSYWTLEAPVRCGLDLRADQWTPRVMAVLNTLCLFTKIWVYCLTKKYTKGQARGNSNDLPMSEMSTVNTTTVSPIHSPLFFVHHNSQRLSRMELEATMSFVAGLVPLCLLTLPAFAWMSWQQLCLYLSMCSAAFTYMYQYSRELLLVHVCTNLLVLIFFSREFKSTVKDNLIRLLHRLGFRTIRNR